MAPTLFARLADEALGAGFRQDELLDACRLRRGRGIQLVLRTNLTGEYHESLWEALALSFDQVVASVDGDGHTHNARRSMGSYEV